MSDIATDLQAAIDAVHAPLPEGRTYKASQVTPECSLKHAAQAMVYRFRELRNMYHNANRELQNLQMKVEHGCIDAPCPICDPKMMKPIPYTREIAEGTND